MNHLIHCVWNLYFVVGSFSYTSIKKEIVTFFFILCPSISLLHAYENAALKLHKSLVSRLPPSASLPGDGADVKAGNEEDGRYFRLVCVAVWRGAGAAAGSLQTAQAGPCQGSGEGHRCRLEKIVADAAGRK